MTNQGRGARLQDEGLRAGRGAQEPADPEEGKEGVVLRGHVGQLQLQAAEESNSKDNLDFEKACLGNFLGKYVFLKLA